MITLIGTRGAKKLQGNGPPKPIFSGLVSCLCSGAMERPGGRPLWRKRVMRRRQFVISALTTTAAAAIGLPAFADDPVKVGLIRPMTGPAASTGKQVAAGARLWLA